MSSNTNNSSSSNKSVPTIHDVIARIRALHINFIAIDFDQTLIDKHTGGVHTGSLHDIITHVRPIFIELINAALQPPPPPPPPPDPTTTETSTTANNDAIHVAIVTYSKQPTLIRSILEHVFGMDMASKIIIRGNDKSWKYEGNGMKDGKQAHMASAVEEILHNHLAGQGGTPTSTTGSADNNVSNNIAASPATTSATTTTSSSSTLEISRSTSLLIDDDPRNIRIALRNGTRAVWYNPKQVPQQLYIDMAQLI